MGVRPRASLLAAFRGTASETPPASYQSGGALHKGLYAITIASPFFRDILIYVVPILPYSPTEGLPFFETLYLTVFSHVHAFKCRTNKHRKSRGMLHSQSTSPYYVVCTKRLVGLSLAYLPLTTHREPNYSRAPYYRSLSTRLERQFKNKCACQHHQIRWRQRTRALQWSDR